MDLTQLTDHILAIRGITDLPVIVDADTGFGNAVNVHRTVRHLEAAGASAIQLEDQVAPKRCGHFEGKSLITGYSAYRVECRFSASAHRIGLFAP